MFTDMKKQIALFAVVLVVSVFFSQSAEAQCAMCKAVVESNIEGDGKVVGRGLNNGILYLMTVPYIILGSLAYMFWKNWKNSRTEPND